MSRQLRPLLIGVGVALTAVAVGAAIARLRSPQVELEELEPWDEEAAYEEEARYAALEEDIPNLHRVNDTLYRGGMPTKEGIQQLADMGIKTVINLHYSPWADRRERQWVEAAGMEYVYLPLRWFGQPPTRKVRRFFELVREAEATPVYIHCLEGKDRTGAMVAAYRISHDGWSAQQAYVEMKRYGFHTFLFVLRGFVFEYAAIADLTRQAIAQKQILT